MDLAFRGLLMGERQPFLALSDLEQDSVMWAVTTAKDLAQGHPIISDESQLKVVTPHLSHVGTEDARVEALCLSMDLTTATPTMRRSNGLRGSWIKRTIQTDCLARMSTAHGA